MDELFPIDHTSIFSHAHTQFSITQLSKCFPFLPSRNPRILSVFLFHGLSVPSPSAPSGPLSYFTTVSIYSPILRPLASNSPMRITKPAWRHLYIHLSISCPFLPTPPSFPLFLSSPSFPCEQRGSSLPVSVCQRVYLN